ncbi:MAG: YraN family protein [Proteobacteria bacterium]|nr:YraN family protein [Pseudomonadota bacterium]
MSPPQRHPSGSAPGRLGWAAETATAWTLRLKGYRIIRRRHKSPVGEIDLIARRGKLLIFIEVKARATYEAAAHSVTRRQRNRIERAAALFLSSQSAYAGFDIRFDVVLITRGRLPIHIKDAWRPN